MPHTPLRSILSPGAWPGRCWDMGGFAWCPWAPWASTVAERIQCASGVLPNLNLFKWHSPRNLCSTRMPCSCYWVKVGSGHEPAEEQMWFLWNQPNLASLGQAFPLFFWRLKRKLLTLGQGEGSQSCYFLSCYLLALLFFSRTVRQEPGAKKANKYMGCFGGNLAKHDWPVQCIRFVGQETEVNAKERKDVSQSHLMQSSL